MVTVRWRNAEEYISFSEYEIDGMKGPMRANLMKAAPMMRNHGTKVRRENRKKKNMPTRLLVLHQANASEKEVNREG